MPPLVSRGVTDENAAGMTRPPDELRVLDVLETLGCVETADELICWSRGPLHAVLPHDVAFFTSGVLIGERRLREDIHRNFPVEYLEHFREADGVCLTPTMKLAFETNRAQVFEPGMDARFSSAQLETFRSFELRNILAHGWMERDTGFATYFSLNRVNGPLRPWHARLLRLVTPQISFALARIRAKERTAHAALERAALPRLTPREIEVLRLLPDGHSNYAIGTILGCRERTVQKHLEHIYPKLDVVTRAQAVHWWMAIGRRHLDTDRPS
jgi:DNA-binding CsgD family transcriptional regulator